MVEHCHHNNCCKDCNQVSEHACPEVGLRGLVPESLHLFVRPVFCSLGKRIDEVKSEAERHEDARDHNVTQSKETQVRVLKNWEFLGEEQLDWATDILGNSDHDLSSKHPEYIVEEESNKESHSDFKVAKEHILNCKDAEENSN